MKKVMKTLLTHLIRFAAFNAITLAVLFGLPALAEHHPFALLAGALAVLILIMYATHKPAAKPKAARYHRTTTHHKAA